MPSNYPKLSAAIDAVWPWLPLLILIVGIVVKNARTKFVRNDWVSSIIYVVFLTSFALACTLPYGEDSWTYAVVAAASMAGVSAATLFLDTVERYKRNKR